MLKVAISLPILFGGRDSCGLQFFPHSSNYFQLVVIEAENDQEK